MQFYRPAVIFTVLFPVFMVLVASAFPLPVLARMPLPNIVKTIDLIEGDELVPVKVTAKGFRGQHWLETQDGAILKQINGQFEFVTYQSGQWRILNGPLTLEEKLSGQFSQPPVKSFARHLNLHDSHAITEQANVISSRQLEIEANLTANMLVILVEFSDQKIQSSYSKLEQLLYKGDRSVASYFNKATKERFKIVAAETVSNYEAFNGIVKVSLPGNHPDFGDDYGAARNKLIEDALAAAESKIDFSSYDKNQDGILESLELGIVLMVAGYEKAYGGDSAWKPNIWGHRTHTNVTVDQVKIRNLAMFGERHDSELASIGIICHELGHVFFDLPDLYDRDGGSGGIGAWGLMGLGGWNTQWGRAGDSPAHLLAWSLEQTGLIEPEVLLASSHSELTFESKIEQVMAKVWLDPYQHNEYLLLETRGHQDFDKSLPGRGLLVTHIDKFVGYGGNAEQNDNPKRKLVDIEEADSDEDLDNNHNVGDFGDLFPGATNARQMSPYTQPSTLTNSGMNTGVRIEDIQMIGDYLSFNVMDDGGGEGKYLGIRQMHSGYTRFTGEVIWTERLEPPFNRLDGLDLFATRSGNLNLTIYDSDNERLYSDSEISLHTGWNRVLFDSSIIAEEGDLTISFNSNSKWYVSREDCQNQNIRFEEASDFDCMLAGWLVSNSENPVSGLPRSKSGGGVVYLLFLFLPLFVILSKLYQSRFRNKGLFF